jgi:hypothetical protein
MSRVSFDLFHFSIAFFTVHVSPLDIPIGVFFRCCFDLAYGLKAGL